MSQPNEKVVAALRQLVEAVNVPTNGEWYRLSFHVRQGADEWEVDALSLTLSRVHEVAAFTMSTSRPKRTEEGRVSDECGEPEPIQPALSAEEWTEALDSYGGDISVPPYPPDEKVEFYNSPRRLAAICLFGQPFGFTRYDVAMLRRTADHYDESGAVGNWHRDLANRIEALLPPEKQ